MKLICNKIINLLIKKKIKISFAESCTGGLISSAITSVSGSSKVFTLGLVTYSNLSKIKILKIPKKIIQKYGAVSAECCKYMVISLNKISNSNICISVTGIAGPGGGTKIKPVGLVYIGLKKGKQTYVKKFIFKNKGRKYVRAAAVRKSFNLILELLK